MPRNREVTLCTHLLTPNSLPLGAQFNTWLDKHGPFDIIVDGANVGYLNQNHDDGFFDHAQIEDVVPTSHAHPCPAVRLIANGGVLHVHCIALHRMALQVAHYEKLGKRVLLVIHKHWLTPTVDLRAHWPGELGVSAEEMKMLRQRNAKLCEGWKKRRVAYLVTKGAVDTACIAACVGGLPAAVLTLVQLTPP